MKAIQYILLVVALLINSYFSSAQQTSLNTLYNQNNYLINPAAAGLKNCFSAYLNHRNQWVGINNAPVRNVLTVDGRIKGKHAFGVDIEMFSAGLLRDFDAKLTYAYHLKLTKLSNLSFGASAGVIQQNFAFDEVITSNYSDVTLTNGNQSDLGFSSDVGLMFSSPKVKLGFSIPQVFASGIVIERPTTTSDFELVRHMIFSGSYHFVQTSQWDVYASGLYRNADFIGHQVDLGLRTTWKNTLGVGAMYRSNYGAIGMVDLTIKNKFSLAYSFGFGVGSRDITSISKGSHEVMIGFTLCKNPPRPTVEEIIVTEVEEIKEIEEIEIIEVDPIKEVIVEEETAPGPFNIDSLNTLFVLRDRQITYNLNSAEEINSENEEKILNEVESLLKDHPELSVTISGNSCDLGSAEYNQAISKKRADDIKMALSKRGISSDRMKVVANGETKPLLPNTTEENRRINRRVQFIFSQE